MWSFASFTSRGKYKAERVQEKIAGGEEQLVSVQRFVTEIGPEALLKNPRPEFFLFSKYTKSLN